MANPLFNEQMQNSLNAQFNSFRTNPIGFLAQRNINIPQEYANDPHGAIQYMLNNNKLSQDRLNWAIQIAQRMGIRL